MQLIKLITLSQGLLCIASLATAIFTWQVAFAKKREIRSIATRALIAALVAAFASFWTTLDSARDSAEHAKTTDNISGVLTEGDSYCYVQFGFPIGEDNAVLAWLINDGKFPLYDVTLHIADLHKMKKIKWRAGIPMKEVSPMYSNLNLGTIGPGRGIQLSTLKIPSATDSYGFNIWITTRHHRFMQMARFKRVNGRWKLAVRLNDEAGEKRVLHESVSREFPKDSLGNTLW